MGLGFSKAEWLLLIPAGSGETVERVTDGRKEPWGLDSTGDWIPLGLLRRSTENTSRSCESRGQEAGHLFTGS